MLTCSGIISIFCPRDTNFISEGEKLILVVLEGNSENKQSCFLCQTQSSAYTIYFLLQMQVCQEDVFKNDLK